MVVQINKEHLALRSLVWGTWNIILTSKQLEKEGVSKMYEDLFQKALNINDPWQLTNIDFNPDGKRIDLYLDFAHGTKFECPVCNKPECSAYDTK